MKSTMPSISTLSRLLPACILLLLVLCLGTVSGLGAADQRIPVILDTDIGDDIDDTWALGLLLKCPELDVKMVIGDHGKTVYRTRLIARFLEIAGRTDIPIGIGVDQNAAGGGPQDEWVRDYDLNRYPGRIHPDGVRAMIDLIMKSPEPITVIAIGPVPNLAVALELEPRIGQKARFAGMHGSVRRGYGSSREVHAEYNVKADIKSCQRVFTAPWEMIITPLDTCGIVDLQGELYGRVRDSQDPVARAIIENYGYWSVRQDAANGAEKARTRSSTLFDTVAVYLAFATDLVKVETLGIRVDDEGFTRIDPSAKTMQVATEWKDLDAFKRFLVERLTRTPAAD
jgi:inosine-uridine nucleoside N-ribohydrolase